MSKLIYLLSILILSFLMPTTGYSSAVPINTKTHQQHSIVKKKRTKKKRYKRVKRLTKTQQTHGMGVVMFTIPALLLIVGLVLLIIGLVAKLVLVWIIGLALLGILVLGIVIFLIWLSTSLNNSNLE